MSARTSLEFAGDHAAGAKLNCGSARETTPVRKAVLRYRAAPGVSPPAMADRQGATAASA